LHSEGLFTVQNGLHAGKEKQLAGVMLFLLEDSTLCPMCIKNSIMAWIVL